MAPTLGLFVQAVCSYASRSATVVTPPGMCCTLTTLLGPGLAVFLSVLARYEASSILSSLRGMGSLCVCVFGHFTIA
jgi:hypothetical protein